MRATFRGIHWNIVFCTDSNWSAQLEGFRWGDGAIAGRAEVAIIAYTLLLTLVPVGGKRITLRDYGVTTDRIWSSSRWAVAAFFAAVPVVAIVAVFFAVLTRWLPEASHPLTRLLEDRTNLVLIGSALVLASVGAPIFEEIMFRGTLLPALKGLTGSLPIAVGLSSLLFAAGHPQGIAGWPALATLGVILCLLTYQTKSILPGMILHALWNTTVAIISLSSSG